MSDSPAPDGASDPGSGDETTASAPGAAPTLRSFWIGGFEGADHVNAHGIALDPARATGHRSRLDEDYANAAARGIRCVRESIGWRLGEPAPGLYDLERARLIAKVARRHGVQVLWTLMHYGTPPMVTLHDDAMIDRFERFAGAVARALADLHDEAPIYTPINAIGFVAWIVCATSQFHPYRAEPEGGSERAEASGYACKRRLVRAALAAIDAIRRVDPRARFMHVEPLMRAAAPIDRPELDERARELCGYQWQAWDMLTGRLDPELGGHPQALDLLGVAHYDGGQWEADTEKRLWWHERDPRRRPLADLLKQAWERYRRPIIVAETGHVGAGRAAWLDEMVAQLRSARGNAVPVDGLCLYPLVDRPDWNDPLHGHRSGLWDVDPAAASAPREPSVSPALATSERGTSLDRILVADYAAAL